jgi:hypothetical protein
LILGRVLTPVDGANDYSVAAATIEIVKSSLSSTVAARLVDFSHTRHRLRSDRRPAMKKGCARRANTNNYENKRVLSASTLDFIGHPGKALFKRPKIEEWSNLNTG